MKIVHHTPDHLILRSIPWVVATLLSVFLLAVLAFGMNAFVDGDFAGAFWGLIAIPLFVGLFLVIFVRRDEVILDRSQDLLELRHSTFRRRTRIKHQLRHLERAKLESRESHKNGTTYRIALVLNGGMDAGTHPVTPVYASGNGAKLGVEAINTWLAQDIDSDNLQA